jgi:hypothetical protein
MSRSSFDFQWRPCSSGGDYGFIMTDGTDSFGRDMLVSWSP